MEDLFSLVNCQIMAKYEDDELFKVSSEMNHTYMLLELVLSHSYAQFAKIISTVKPAHNST